MTNSIPHKKAFRKMIWRSFSQSAGINSETMQGLGFGYAMLPYLRMLYQGKELEDSLKRETQFFNTYPGSIGFIMGVTAKQEEEQATAATAAGESQITQLKIALMGPLAALGDSLMMNLFRVILTVIGIDFAYQGNLMGPLFVLVAFHGPYLWLRIQGSFLGYHKGPLFFQSFLDDGRIANLTQWLTQVKLALLGFLVYRGIQVPLPDSLQGVNQTVSAMFPNWLGLLFVIVGVGLGWKPWGRKGLLVLLVLLSFVLAYLME